MDETCVLTIFDTEYTESDPKCKKRGKRDWRCIDPTTRSHTDFPSMIYKRCPAVSCSKNIISNTFHNNYISDKLIYHKPKKVRKFFGSMKKNPPTNPIQVPLFIKILTKTVYNSQYESPSYEKIIKGFESFGMIPQDIYYAGYNEPICIKLVRGLPSVWYNAFNDYIFNERYKITYIRRDSPLFENVLACIYEGIIYIANHGSFINSLYIDQIQCLESVDISYIFKN